MSTTSRRLTGFAAAMLSASACIALAIGTIGLISTSGVSMSPTFHTGDLVVIARADDYRIGQVVAYDNPIDGDQVLHRIVGGSAAAWDIRGDHNESIDAFHPSSDQLVGRAVLHVAGVGRFMTSPLLLVAAGLAVTLLVIGLTTMFGKRSAGRSRRGHIAPSPSTRRSSNGRGRLVGFLVLDAVLIAGAAAAFALSPTPTATAPAAQQTGTFRYSGSAARTDTYPTGLVSTGAPVFTRLVDTVDVSFDLAADLPPGHVTATAQLDAHVSNASGWSAVLPLAPAAQMHGGVLVVTGTLHLRQIDDLAARVADETGVSAGAVSVIVTATGAASVEDAAAMPFVFEMPMQLTPLTLSLAGVVPTDTSDGQVVSSQLPLSIDTAEPRSSGVPTNVRRALLVALLLSLATTVVVWPASAKAGSCPPTDDELHRELIAAGAGAAGTGVPGVGH